jgi:asparagine synthase (glutamine-hydrolysing)
VERFVDLIRRGHMASAWRLAAVMQRSSGPGSVARAMLRALPSDIAVLLWRKWIGRSCPSWLDVEFFDQAGISTAASSADMSESFDVALLDAQSTSSLPGLLRYEDRNSMAASVESRVPFVTADLASFAATLPASYLINREGRSKSILIDAMRGLVPDSVLDRRDKVAFSVPQRQWMAAVAQPVGQPPGVIANASEQSDVRLWSYTQFWNAMHTI